MTASSRDPSFRHELLPGRPDDYLGTVVMDLDLLAPLEERGCIQALLNDNVSLPRTDARDGHSADRHLEYWLSGLRDARLIMHAAGLKPESECTVLALEYGGCGRVIRHIARDMPNAHLFFGTSDQAQLSIVNGSIGRDVNGFQGPLFPTLPFPDAFFDGAFAFSVLPRGLQSCAWILEFKRVLKAGGRLVVTIDDVETLPSPGEASSLDSSGAPPLCEEGSQADDTLLQADDSKPPIRLLLDLWKGLFRVDSVELRPHDRQIVVVLCA